MRRFWTFLILLSYSRAVCADASAIHIVTAGETLSQIVLVEVARPDRSRLHSAMKVVLDLNPKIQNPNRIYVGQRILLREAVSPVAVALPPVPFAIPREPAEEPTTGSTEKAAPPVAAEPPSTISNNEEPPHHFLFDLGAGVRSLTATDLSTQSQAKLNSSVDLSAGFGWEQEWTPSFSTYGAATLTKIEFEPLSSATKTLEARAKTLTLLKIGGENRLTETFSLKYELGYGHQLFTRGTSTSSLTIDSIPLPQATVSLPIQIFRKGKTTVGAAISGSAIGSGSSEEDSIESGSSMGVSFSVRREYGHSNFVELVLGGAQRTQQTSSVRIQESDVSAKLIFKIPLFRGD